METCSLILRYGADNLQKPGANFGLVMASPSAAKAVDENNAVIAAVNRCATQKKSGVVSSCLHGRHWERFLNQEGVFFQNIGIPKGGLIARPKMSDRSLSADDFTLKARDCSQHFVLFFIRNLELVERLNQMLDRDGPVLFGDTQPGVGRPHVASGIDARATRRVT